MESLKRRWQRLPATVRRPLVMVVGSLFILAAALTGWLPGPGGVPLFLIGIAILATEFSWAKKVQDAVIGWIEYLGRQWRRHKVIGTIIIICGAAAAGTIGWLIYSRL